MLATASLTSDLQARWKQYDRNAAAYEYGQLDYLPVTELFTAAEVCKHVSLPLLVLIESLHS